LGKDSISKAIIYLQTLTFILDMFTKKFFCLDLSILLFALLINGCFLKRKAFNDHDVHLKRASIVKISTDTLASKHLEEDLLVEYRKNLDAIMNVEIGNTNRDLKKEKPNGTLGNMVADALLWKANTIEKTDAAVINYGGIRVPVLMAGKITLGEVFEIMPFDNTISIVKMNSDELKVFCNHIAQSGGWPVSGISFSIDSNKAVAIKINNQPLRENETYKIAMSDYVAGGGDKAAFLKILPATKTQVLVRDAIIEFVKYCASIKSDLIKSPLERITK
jgi:2',3'-cyclic-nucleotide 2'-phosphodiesterase (5'-nucleotidase family)